MKIKNIMLSMTTALTLFTGITTNTIAKEIDETSCNQIQSNELESNQTEIFYMYSNKEGHFFLDPKAETENVIFIGLNDFKIDASTLHHGKKFIGTFADDSLWELVRIEEVE